MHQDIIRRMGRKTLDPFVSARSLMLHEATDHHPTHGFKTWMPQYSKSPALRVASTAPRERAIEAICASNCAMGRPAIRRAAAILENARAASLSKGRMRSAKS